MGTVVNEIEIGTPGWTLSGYVGVHGFTISNGAIMAEFVDNEIDGDDKGSVCNGVSEFTYAIKVAKVSPT